MLMYLPLFLAYYHVVYEEYRQMDIALICCFLPMNKQERNASIKQLLEILHEDDYNRGADHELGQVISFLFRSTEWLSLPGHIDCLKFFLLTPDVRELISLVFVNGTVHS